LKVGEFLDVFQTFVEVVLVREIAAEVEYDVNQIGVALDSVDCVVILQCEFDLGLGFFVLGLVANQINFVLELTFLFVVLLSQIK